MLILFCRCLGNLTIKLTDRRPDDDVMMPTCLEQRAAQAEVESGAAVRVERFVRREHRNVYCRVNVTVPLTASASLPLSVSKEPLMEFPVKVPEI